MDIKLKGDNMSIKVQKFNFPAIKNTNNQNKKSITFGNNLNNAVNNLAKDIIDSHYQGNLRKDLLANVPKDSDLGQILTKIFNIFEKPSFNKEVNGIKYELKDRDLSARINDDSRMFIDKGGWFTEHKNGQVPSAGHFSLNEDGDSFFVHSLNMKEIGDYSCAKPHAGMDYPAVYDRRGGKGNGKALAVQTQFMPFPAEIQESKEAQSIMVLLREGITEKLKNYFNNII